jgi:hypothetical protein
LPIGRRAPHLLTSPPPSIDWPASPLQKHGPPRAAYEGLPQVTANANPVCLSRDYSLVPKDLHGLLRAQGRSNCIHRGELVTCAVLGGAKGAYEVSMRSSQPASVLIKRYDAERLYDVDLRRYIVLDELYAWQLMAVPFIVQDAKSGEDVTAAVLAGPDGPTLRLDPNGASIY